MDDDQRRYRVNSTDIVHEMIDGEVIAIDLARGSYYSLSGSAADVWAMLAARDASLGDLVSAFDTLADREKAERAISGLMARLSEERLILDADDTEEALRVNGAAQRFPYRPPVFEKYDDMQDYFLLDPIHDVGTAGWPPPAPEARP